MCNNRKNDAFLSNIFIIIYNIKKIPIWGDLTTGITDNCSLTDLQNGFTDLKKFFYRIEVRTKRKSNKDDFTQKSKKFIFDSYSCHLRWTFP